MLADFARAAARASRSGALQWPRLIFGLLGIAFAHMLVYFVWLSLFPLALALRHLSLCPLPQYVTPTYTCPFYFHPIVPLCLYSFVIR
jgi:hypothetical protein